MVFDVDSVRDEDCRDVETPMVGYAAVFLSSSFPEKMNPFARGSWVKSLAIDGVWVRDVTQQSGSR